ncbi:DUF3108 domain-containing protein, partial [Fulvivirga sp. RKSG066]|uniref:DUF3108 domain-containing protein n=1 Tax=Fulvivirga aurantia TaxID=2529383 RepID=UPI0012BD7C97
MIRFISILLLLSLSAFMTADKDAVYPKVDYSSFARGEKLTYRVNFGIFTIGKGEMIISDKLYKINKRDCYKVDVYGKTSGMVDWVARVDDHWGAYVDTAALVPHISYRNIKEGNYRKNEMVRFDHEHDVLETKTINKKTGKWKEPILYGAPDNVREMLSGFLYLRTMDFSQMKKGDIFTISGFFEDMFYELDVKYRGKEKVKTKAGKFRAIKLEPIMPDNELFDGEDSILAWISDDENKIPLKVEAKMFIGHTGVELS